MNHLERGAGTVVDPVAERARTTPDRTAMIDADRGTNLPYRRYDERVADVAAGLAAHDVDALGVLLEPGPEYGVVVFAAMRTGTTVVPLSLRETQVELDAKCARAGIDAIVCGPETEAKAADLDVGRVYTVEPRSDLDRPSLADRSPGETGGADWSDGIDDAKSDSVDPSRTLLVVFTSGTTGEPKGVRLTVSNLLSSATASAFRLGVTPADRWLCCLPMYHMGGLAPVIRAALYGTTVVIQRAFDPTATARVMEAHAVTGVSLVPTTLKRLLDDGWSPPDSLRFVLLGGAPASRELLDRSLDAGVPVHPTYGATETASQVATATPAQVEAHPGTVGQPLSGTRVTVVDESGAPLPPGERGELVVSGPTVTPGYLDDDRTLTSFSEYGFHTGDVGSRDEDGHLWIDGRVTDRIVTGGENVDPRSVATVLADHPGIAEAAVVGLPDEEWGERVGALVVPSDERSPPAIESILDHCEERLAGFKRPRTIAVVEGLPRTDSGTLDREAARERLQSDGIDR